MAAVLEVAETAPDGLDGAFGVLKAASESRSRRSGDQMPSTGLRPGA
ncbi:hypothetical protein [Streptomyces glaucus]